MKYYGIELEEVTEPQLFNPPKKMLVWDNDVGCPSYANVCAVVRSKDFPVICDYSTWRHCAEIPEQKLATYRELSRWIAEGNGEVTDELNDEGAIYTQLFYWKGRENDAVVDSVHVRKWDDTEWHKPTREYLGLEDKQ